MVLVNMGVVIRILLLLSAGIVFGEATYDYDAVLINELPPNVGEDLLNMLTSIFDPPGSCTGPPKTQAQFLLYTRSNPNEATVLDPNNPEAIDPTKHTVIIAHGWLLGPSYGGIQKLKAAYLERYDCNLVLIDWSELAMQTYTQTVCDTPGIAETIAKFLCKLPEISIPLDELHLVGQSTGAHILGVAGYKAKQMCSQEVGRITALDIPGPTFMKRPAEERLSKLSGKFVDIIHTDALGFGHLFAVGHVDFHANCGLPQPGCLSKSQISDTSRVVDALCSHLRSLNLMIESVSSSDFIAVSCSMCAHYCHADIISEVYTVMGEECRTIPKPAKNFLIRTNKVAPYAQGWKPYE